MNVLSLAHNIKKYRKKLDITQEELAGKIFVSGQAVSKWERGSAVPDLDKLCDLANIFGISLDMLVGHMSDDKFYMIGVDGGGTKTELVLFSQEGKIIKRSVKGGMNPNLYGIENSLSVLKEGIDEMLSVKPNVEGIYVGSAGFMSGDYAQKALLFLREEYKDIKSDCSSDIISAVASGTDEESCIGSISGTGNIVVAVENGTYTRYGGWGKLFEKAGSGYDIGREVLHTAFAERDGLGGYSIMTALAEKKLGGTAWECISRLYKESTAYIASFATIAFEAYEMGDFAARRIIEENAERAAYVVNKAYEKHPGCSTVVLTGSLYNNRHFLSEVRKNLNPGLKTVVGEKPQVYGACKLCCRLCGVKTDGMEEKFMEEYKMCGKE